jgi:hypothetical protein
MPGFLHGEEIGATWVKSSETREAQAALLHASRTTPSRSIGAAKQPGVQLAMSKLVTNESKSLLAKSGARLLLI